MYVLFTVKVGNCCIISEMPRAEDVIQGKLEMELKDGMFTETLEDKTTNDYRTLRSTVVEEVCFL